MGDQNNIPLIKEKHRTENTINANKCELSKVQILLACFMQKQILMQKQITIDTQFLEGAEGSLRGRSIENNIFTTWKQH